MTHPFPPPALTPTATVRRVLLSGTSYPPSPESWQGQFIRQMVLALARRRDVALSTWLPPGDLPGAVGDATTVDDARWLKGLLADGGIAHLLRRRPIAGGFAALNLLRRLHSAQSRSDAHLFHVNWLQNALALPNDSRPALVTALGSDMHLLRLPGMKAALRRVFRTRRVLLCPNSQWMVPPLEAAFGGTADILATSFGIDPCWYAIHRREDGAALRPWLCVTRLTAAKLGPLFDWGRAHFSGERQLHLFGPAQESVSVPGWVHWHGPASPEELCSRWFPQACGLISLSEHAEGRPQVMLEAMASGLPILASRIPAHEDIIGHGRTGWLCGSEAELETGIAALEDPVRNREMGRLSRAWVAENVGDWDDCASRYSAHYDALLDRSA